MNRRTAGLALLTLAAGAGAGSLLTVRAELLEASVSADGLGLDLVVRNPSPFWAWTFEAEAAVPDRAISFLSEPLRLHPGEVGKIPVSATGPVSPCETFRIRVRPRGLPWGQAAVEGRLARDCPE